jgi:hypothetical protein
MPIDVPVKDHETALRRQITSVNIGVELDTGTPAKQLPTLTAQVCFTDMFTRGDGAVVAYPVAGSVTLTNSELLAIQHALSVIAEIQTLANQRAVEQGI